MVGWGGKVGEIHLTDKKRREQTGEKGANRGEGSKQERREQTGEKGANRREGSKQERREQTGEKGANRREGSSKFLKIHGTYFLNGPISIFNKINKRKLSERVTHASHLNLLVHLGSQCIKSSTFLES